MAQPAQTDAAPTAGGRGLLRAAAMNRAVAELRTYLIRDLVDLAQAIVGILRKQLDLPAGGRKVTGCKTDQTHRLKVRLRPSIEQFERGAPQHISSICRLVERRSAGDSLEISKSDLETHGARQHMVRPQSLTHTLDVPKQDIANLLRVGEINAEGLLMTDAPGVAAADHRANVAASTEPSEPVAEPAKVLDEGLSGPALEVAERPDAQPVEAGLGGLADPPHAADGQRREEILYGVHRDDGEAVGLVQIGGEFGQKLVGGGVTAPKQSKTSRETSR